MVHLGIKVEELRGAWKQLLQAIVGQTIACTGGLTVALVMAGKTRALQTA